MTSSLGRGASWGRTLKLLAVLMVAVLWSSGCRSEGALEGHYVLKAYWSGEGIPGGALLRPFGVAVGPKGGVYVTDARKRVVRLDSQGKFTTQWGHEGAGAGDFGNPVGVAVGPDGAVYVSDYDQDRIQKFTAAGKFLLEFGQSGTAPGQFDAPAGLGVDDSGRLYVADFYNDRVQEMTADGRPARVIGYPGRVGRGALHYPTGVTALGDGSVLVADAYNYQLQWFDKNGHYKDRSGYRLLWLWPRPAGGRRGFNVPTGVAVGPRGLIHVADSGNHRVVMLSADGTYLAEWRIPEADPRIFSPEQIAVASDGKTVYASDLAANRVIVLTVEGEERSAQLDEQ